MFEAMGPAEMPKPLQSTASAASTGSKPDFSRYSSRDQAYSSEI